MRNFLIDTDTASDDAVALIMALRHPGVRVVGITVVAGNVSLQQSVANALLTVEFAGATAPVFPGVDKPLLRPHEDASWFHGRDGLGDQFYPPAKAAAAATHAVDAILELSRAHPGLTLVTLGPLTNIALALLRDPTLAIRIARCVVMGGAPCTEGNVTPAAEYNIWCDPEAARIVFNSGMPIEMIGWQLCRGAANLRADDIAAVRAINTPLAHFVLDCNRVAAEANRTQTGEVGIALPDPTAMAVALDPSIATHATNHAVAIATDELTRGMTIIDKLNVSQDPRNVTLWRDTRPASIVWSLDIPKFKHLLLNCIKGA
jgi:purine nucleosidase